ncbi:Nramp family divalent metal transporter [Clostridium sp. CX1]|uniref:Nramp family divalent metal transporter n=1 Tax=Clostridium sp. CX1 TaxID=2978346 RepID=UPI0021BECA95|nr:Nramp family divalent metal transporter [Clostridium sp. CX1]MCT8977122.1 Nramp family divalent metal transporter [Clostridium sp. CX1]
MYPETEFKDLTLTKSKYRWDLATKVKGVLKYLGPAFIVSVAYVDPGNFATNITGGSVFNYNLIWVILWSNLMAIFLQTLSAKLGIATGFNLSQMCGKIFSKKVNWFLWTIACITAMATTLAEFLGASLGLYLLFRIPLTYAGVITVILTFIIVNLQKYGQRAVELVITVLVSVICIAYGFEVILADPKWTSVALHALVPSLPNSNALYVAVGMLGATVMPHVIYLHSALVQSRNKNSTKEEKARHLKMEKIDITIAMNIAFLVNSAMVIVSAAVFFSQGIAVDSIEQAHKSLQPLLGSLSSGAFGIALLASGLSSSAVGAMAGESLMDGFVNLKINTNLKRIITMAPGMIIILLGVNPMKALVSSQVILSFALPAAVIPLMIISSKKDIMGEMVNRPSTKVIGWIITSIIISLNLVLLFLTFTGKN